MGGSWTTGSGTRCDGTWAQRRADARRDVSPFTDGGTRVGGRSAPHAERRAHESGARHRAAASPRRAPPPLPAGASAGPRRGALDGSDRGATGSHRQRHRQDLRARARGLGGAARESRATHDATRIPRRCASSPSGEPRSSAARRPDPEEVIRQHPEHAEALRRGFGAAALLDQVLQLEGHAPRRRLTWRSLQVRSGASVTSASCGRSAGAAWASSTRPSRSPCSGPSR